MVHKENFDETRYLKNNPDVASAIEEGQFKSGYDHYTTFGFNEKRILPRVNKEQEAIMVSIIMPNYNKERFIGHAIESIICQDYQNLELLVVDDVSTDGSVGIIQSYAKKDKRIKLIQHRANSGGCAAPRNTGLLAAKGEVVCFLDSDDFLFNGTISSRVEAYITKAKNNPDVIGVYSGTWTVREDYADIPCVKEIKNMKVIDFISTAGDCPFNANQPMLKTRELQKFGGFDEYFTQAEDWHLWNRILRHGYAFVPTGHNGVAYREGPESMVKENSFQHVSNSFAILSSYYEELPEDEIVPDTPFVYKKPWYEYKRQIQLAGRFFSFLSMNRDTEPVGNITEHLLPDLEALGNNIKIFDATISGYKRKLASSSAPNDIILRTMGRPFHQIYSNAFRKEEEKVAFPSPQTTSNPFIHPNNLNDIDVIFFPHSAYHVLELSYIHHELKKLGLNGLFINSSIPYRDQGVLERIIELDLPHVNFTNYKLFDSFRPKAAICLCDWDLVVKPVITEYNSIGIPTFAIVEGVQDYNDADTGRPRAAYREVKHLFLPGEFDKKYFPDHENLYVGGISRIEDLLKEEPFAKKSIDVVINVNFTYGVLEDKREQWIDDVVSTCAELGLSYTISQHHADKGNLSNYNVSEEPLYDLLRKSKTLITRFSTTVLESLALKTPVVYYNPNIEKVDKFDESMGAYEYARDLDNLRESLRRANEGWDSYSKHSDNFLKLHCNTAKSIPTKQYIAEKLVEIIQ